VKEDAMPSSPRWVVILLLTSLLALPGDASAQETHLGDVAESIRLDHPAGEPVIIDDQSFPPAVSPAEGAPYTERLAGIAEAYRSAVERLETTLGEMDRGMVLYDPEWRSAVEDICLDIEELTIEVTAATPSPPYAEAHEALRAATREYGEAIAAVRRAVANMTPTIGERLVHLRDGRLWLERAQALAEKTRERLELESTPAEVVGSQGFDGGEAVCAARYPTDPDLEDACLRVQERAVRELEGRTAFGLGLDDATFNAIRNRCQLEWGTDYEGRNDCEKRALAELEGE
jgi:hypothetical protein